MKTNQLFFINTKNDFYIFITKNINLNMEGYFKYNLADVYISLHKEGFIFNKETIVYKPWKKIEDVTVGDLKIDKKLLLFIKEKILSYFLERNKFSYICEVDPFKSKKIKLIFGYNTYLCDVLEYKKVYTIKEYIKEKNLITKNNYITYLSAAIANSYIDILDLIFEKYENIFRKVEPSIYKNFIISNYDISELFEWFLKKRIFNFFYTFDDETNMKISLQLKAL
jgi:hypothetical protein